MKVVDGLYIYPWTSYTENNCNTYVIGAKGEVMIDPGHTHLFENVSGEMAKDDLDVAGVSHVLATHSHHDHFEGVEFWKDKPEVRIGLGARELEFVEGEGRQLAAMFGMNMPDYRVDMELAEGEISIAGLDLQVFHTPGHSPGHVCIYWPEARILFSGDLIFNQGVGRTDFPGGDGELLKKSIQRMAELDIQLILSGHGEPVQGADAVKQNFEIIEKTYFAWI